MQADGTLAANVTWEPGVIAGFSAEHRRRLEGRGCRPQAPKPLPPRLGRTLFPHTSLPRSADSTPVCIMPSLCFPLSLLSPSQPPLLRSADLTHARSNTGPAKTHATHVRIKPVPLCKVPSGPPRTHERTDLVPLVSFLCICLLVGEGLQGRKGRKKAEWHTRSVEEQEGLTAQTFPPPLDRPLVPHTSQFCCCSSLTQAL